MAEPRWQAIAFADPGLGAFGRAGGLTVTPTGALATTSGDAAVRQAILLLLTTRPGERVMRPTYGSHLHRLIFAPNDPTTAGAILAQFLKNKDADPDAEHVATNVERLGGIKGLPGADAKPH